MGSARLNRGSTGSRKHAAYLMIPLRVHDPERVAQLLCEFLTHGGFWLDYANGRLTGLRKRGDGSKTRLLEEAATWFGLSYSVLHRLAHGKSKHITWRNYFKLEKRLTHRDEDSAKFWADLGRVLIGPKTRRILASYTGAIEQGIEWDRKMSSVTWDYWFGNHNPELLKLDALIKRLGLPATRWDLARRRAVAPVLSWPKLRKHSWDKRPQLLKLGIRFECELVREEARVLRKLLQDAA
jgi:hypothetical protein